MVLRATTIAEAAKIRKDGRNGSEGTGTEEEARGASRTHFSRSSGGTGAFGQRNREGKPERQQCREGNPDRRLIEVARFRWRSGQGTERDRKESIGNQGTDRGRKAPAGTPPKESASALTGSGRDLRKVGAGGDTSPHFHFRAICSSGPADEPPAAPPGQIDRFQAEAVIL